MVESRYMHLPCQVKKGILMFNAAFFGFFTAFFPQVEKKREVRQYFQFKKVLLSSSGMRWNSAAVVR